MFLKREQDDLSSLRQPHGCGTTCDDLFKQFHLSFSDLNFGCLPWHSDTPATAVNLVNPRRVSPALPPNQDRFKTPPLVKVVDTAKESGVTFGPEVNATSLASLARQGTPTYTMYKVAQLDELNDQASELAMQNARTRAARLAQLAGGKLGVVRSVQEINITSYRYGLPGVQTLTRGSSAVYRKITLNVSLTVQFELVFSAQPSQ